MKILNRVVWLPIVALLMSFAFFGSIASAQAPAPEGPAPLTANEILDVQDLVTDWVANGNGRLLLEILNGQRVIFDSAIVLSGSVEIHGFVAGAPVTMTVPVDNALARSIDGEEVTHPCFDRPLSVRTPYSSPFGLWGSSDPANVILSGKVVPFYERFTLIAVPGVEIMLSGSAVSRGNTTLCHQKYGDDINFDYARYRVEVDAVGAYTVTDLVASGVMTITADGKYVER